MLGGLRDRLQLVQQDFTSSFRTLGDRTRDNRTRRTPRFEESFPHFTAGVEILSRFEDSWFLLHKRTTGCAQAAEGVDGDTVMLSAHWEKKRTSLTQLQEQLQTLPAFISDLDAITANIAHLEGDFEEIESRLVHLETLCVQCEQQTSEQQHVSELEAYQDKKRRALEALQVELNAQHVQNLAELEQAMVQKMKERQKVYDEAFKEDVKKYLSSGGMQQREPLSEADECVLDQITISNLSDQEALDDFLNSTDDDISTGSSLTSGPDLDSSLFESVRSQVSPTLSTNDQLFSQNVVEEGDSEEIGELLVQSDEEDVQQDPSLTDLDDDGTVRVSDK
ncbi:dysbindin-A-like [Antennarius striatus]|uniref:dysbindin-A-like n=1 Tax=Antennarius striatus TaxID=241820 RepID=UPI0035B24F0B